MKTYKTYR